MKDITSKIAWGIAFAIVVALIAIISLAALSTRASGQILYGFNGTNVPENLNPLVRSQVVELFPSTDQVVLVFRNDKYTGKAPQSDIDNVIALNNDLGGRLRIVYTFNTRGAVSVTDNYFAFNALKGAGVSIIAARLGNEEYFKAAGHNTWDDYLFDATPVLNALADDIPVLIPVAEPSNTRWNTPAIAYINSDSRFAPDIHYYWGRNDVPALGTLVNDQLPSELSNGTYLPNADAFYLDLYNQVTTSSLFEDVMNWHIMNFPAKKMWVTEFGPCGNVGSISGTIGFEATADWFLNKINDYPDYVAVVCKFNGPSITGIITPKAKLDPDGFGTHVERLSYFTLKQFYANKQAIAVRTIEAPGTYTISYHNIARVNIDLQGLIPVADGLQVDAVSYEGIAGQNFYSSSGACQWWANGSVKSYEVTGAATYDYIPEVSYGYITITVSKAPIYGCMDRTAQNYNPSATIDDGSCTYPPPPPPTVCYKQRILFKSLGCKVDKNCQFNNCKN